MFNESTTAADEASSTEESCRKHAWKRPHLLPGRSFRAKDAADRPSCPACRRRAPQSDSTAWGERHGHRCDHGEPCPGWSGRLSECADCREKRAWMKPIEESDVDASIADHDIRGNQQEDTRGLGPEEPEYPVPELYLGVDRPVSRIDRGESLPHGWATRVP